MNLYFRSSGVQVWTL